MELVDLMVMAQQGDEDAFAEICKRFTGLVRKHARQPHLRQLGEDAEAEAWLAVVRAVRTFRAEAGVQPAGYIDSQVRYALWNLFKKERRKWQGEVAAEAGSGDSLSVLDTMTASDNTEQMVERRIDSIELQDALARLPERQGQALRLTFIECRRLNEAARVMGITPQAVTNLQQRGLARLKKSCVGIY